MSFFRCCTGSSKRASLPFLLLTLSLIVLASFTALSTPFATADVGAPTPNVSFPSKSLKVPEGQPATVDIIRAGLPRMAHAEDLDDGVEAVISKSNAARAARTLGRGDNGTEDASSSSNTTDDTPRLTLTDAVVDPHKTFSLVVAGSGYTVIRFQVRRGNAVALNLQLRSRDTDLDESKNCEGFTQINVDLLSQWRHPLLPPSPNADTNERNATGGYDFPAVRATNNDSQWKNLWDSIALLLDSSPFCRVFRGLSMHVRRAPRTEDFYAVVFTETYAKVYHYDEIDGMPNDVDYKCGMDVFLEQQPERRLFLLQLFFALLLPLAVVLLPLPALLWNADVLQYSMATESWAEYIWALPYLMRRGLAAGLDACLEGVRRRREARAQAALEERQRQLAAQLEALRATQFGGASETAAAEAPVTATDAPATIDMASAHAVLSTDATDEQQQQHTQHTEQTEAIKKLTSTKTKILSKLTFGDAKARATDVTIEDVLPNDACEAAAVAQATASSPESAEAAAPTAILSNYNHSNRSSSNNQGVTIENITDAPEEQNCNTISEAADQRRHDVHALLFTVPEDGAVKPPRLPEREERDSAGTSAGADATTAKSEVAGSSGSGSSGGTKGTATVVAPTQDAEEEEEEKFCRICRDDGELEKLIAPCECTGSVRWVHRSCLDRWRIESAKRNATNVNNCEICKTPFKMGISHATLFRRGASKAVNAVVLFFLVLLCVVMYSFFTYGVVGELSCTAPYHEVDYSNMYLLPGLMLSFLVYVATFMLFLFSAKIVYSWYRVRPDTVAFLEENRFLPPFWTFVNVLRIVGVCLVIVLQVLAVGYISKFLLYFTSSIVWNWEISPIFGGILLFFVLSFGMGVVAEAREGMAEHRRQLRREQRRAERRAAAAAAAAAANADGNNDNNNNNDNAVEEEGGDNNTNGPAAPLNADPNDVDYTRHFEIPPEQRTIRAVEYCPPRLRF